MNEMLLKKYVTLDNIKEYAKKEGIMIDDYEAKIIYDYIFKNYSDIYTSDNYDFSNLKNKIKNTTYDKIIELYNKYKKS